MPMLGLPRFALPDQPQHVIQRGNNRLAIFACAEDYAFYLDKLAEACRRFGRELHAYLLMTNHAHLMMTPRSGDGIAKVMQSLGRHYVGYFNSLNRRTGTLWEGRYRATIASKRRCSACPDAAPPPKPEAGTENPRRSMTPAKSIESDPFDSLIEDIRNRIGLDRSTSGTCANG